MVTVRSTAHDGGVPRLIVLWARPRHRTAEEAERWARAEVRALLAVDAVRSASLTQLESASARHGSDWDWLLELDIALPARDCVDRGPCAEWLGDLRLLGMRPAVMLAGDGVAVEAEDE
jgi:hypothetical protein